MFALWYLLRRLELRTRILLLILLATLSIAVVLIQQSITLHQDNVSKIYSEASTLVLRAAAYPKEILPEPRRYLMNLSDIQAVRHPDNCASFVATLEPATKLQPYFARFELYKLNGAILCSTVTETDRRETNAFGQNLPSNRMRLTVSGSIPRQTSKRSFSRIRSVTTGGAQHTYSVCHSLPSVLRSK
jgi:hypothetical protein